MNKDAVERGQEMLVMPMNQLPPLAVEFAQKLCNELGGCIEVFLTAYAVYAQCVEGLRCKDSLYKVIPEHKRWFLERGYDNSKQKKS